MLKGSKSQKQPFSKISLKNTKNRTKTNNRTSKTAHNSNFNLKHSALFWNRLIKLYSSFIYPWKLTISKAFYIQNFNIYLDKYYVQRECGWSIFLTVLVFGFLAYTWPEKIAVEKVDWSLESFSTVYFTSVAFILIWVLGLEIVFAVWEAGFVLFLFDEHIDTSIWLIFPIKAWEVLSCFI